MIPADVAQLLGMLVFLLLVFVVGGWFADRADPDRQDAKGRAREPRYWRPGR